MNNILISDFDDLEIKNCKIILENIDDILSIKIIGQLDTYNSIPFQHKMNLILKDKFKKIIFNFSELNYVSSTGIGAFIQILKDSDKNDKKIVLAEIQTKVFEIFKLLGFNSFFKIFDDQQTAFKYFKEFTETSIFPKILKCITCDSKLRAMKSGKFRCTKCKSILIIDSNGKMFKE